MLNNWTPETASLIATLKRHGFEIVRGNNGEEGFKFDGDMKKFIANLIACDEAHLYVRHPKIVTGEGNKITCSLFLVLGNSPGEIVCDYGTTLTDTLLDAAVTEHANRWEGRKQPKQTAAQAYPHIYSPAAIAEREAAYAKRQAEQEAHVRQLTEGGAQ